MKKIILDKGTGKRIWRLYYDARRDFEISHFEISPLVKSVLIEFWADTHKEALEKALQLLKKQAKKDFLRFFNPYYYVVMLDTPSSTRRGEKYVLASNLYRLKFRYANSSDILKIQNPSQCFVRGYGPKAASELDAS